MLYILNILVIGSLRHQRILFFCIEQKNYPIKSLCPCVANIIISLFFKNLFGGGGGGGGGNQTAQLYLYAIMQDIS